MRVLTTIALLLLATPASAFSEGEHERGRRACAFVTQQALGSGDGFVVQQAETREVLVVFLEVTLTFADQGQDGQSSVCKLAMKNGEPVLTETVLNGKKIGMMQNGELHHALKALYASDPDLPEYPQE